MQTVFQNPFHRVCQSLTRRGYQCKLKLKGEAMAHLQQRHCLCSPALPAGRKEQRAIAQLQWRCYRRSQMPHQHWQGGTEGNVIIA